MSWVTWRQHRGEALAALAFSVLFAALVLLTGVQMHRAFDDQGVASCLVVAAPPSCSGVVGGYQQQFSAYISLYQWLNLLPLVFGIFVGAPLVAREIERNTHLLVWTQGVTRTRWVVSKVLLLLGVTTLLAVAFTLLMGWWLQPLRAIDGSALPPSEFDLQGVVPVGYFAAALAIGTAAGALIRRTLPAMAVALVAFLALRFGTIDMLRPSFMAPLMTSNSIAATPGTRPGDWILSDYLTDASGHVLSGRFPIDHLCGAGNITKEAINACLQAHGVVETILYQPASRYWAFQGIELAEFALVAALLLLLTVWWVRRRIS